MTNDDLEVTDAQPEGIGNAADPVEMRKHREAVADEVAEEDAVWRDVIATPVGRRAMWKFLQTCSFGATRFACGPNGFPQTEATWFQAGERETARRLHDALFRIDGLAVLEMHKEHDPAFPKPVQKRRKKVS